MLDSFDIVAFSVLSSVTDLDLDPDLIRVQLCQ
jgi:hypothetical protein